MEMTKRLRLSIDFSIKIADTPPETDELNPFDPVYHARQVRLLEAVKKHPQVLIRWMHSLIVGEMHAHGWHDWDNMLLGGELGFRDILAPVLKALPEKDQEFFSQKIPHVYFEDLIDLFLASFTLKEEPAVIVEQEEKNIVHPLSD